MIIYNKEWLDNLRIQETGEKWFRRNQVSQMQLTEIEQQYVSGYKHTNLFVRIGLFLFTFILATCAIGLVGLLMSGAIESIGFMLLLFAGITWYILEQFVKQRKYYRNGIDDMLLYISLSYFISGLGVIIFNMTDTISLNIVLLTATIVLPVLVLSAIRFADSLVCLMAYLCLLLVIFIVVHKTGEIGKALMPFVIMMVSFFTYRFVTRLKESASKYYWLNCFNTIETASLIALYAAGNYFVVRESSALLFDLFILPGEDIPFAILFYILTLSIPIAYIIYGIKNKDRILLRTGIILSALAILTYRYYYHFINAEFAMIIAGAILFCVSGYVIRKLKTPCKGFTFKHADKERDFVEVESLLIAQTFGKTTTKSNDIDFGGGSFGGGGAGGGF